jgi:hypothetical protein
VRPVAVAIRLKGGQVEVIEAGARVAPMKIGAVFGFDNTGDYGLAIYSANDVVLGFYKMDEIAGVTIDEPGQA